MMMCVWWGVDLYLVFFCFINSHTAFSLGSPRSSSTFLGVSVKHGIPVLPHIIIHWQALPIYMFNRTFCYSEREEIFAGLTAILVFSLATEHPASPKSGCVRQFIIAPRSFFLPFPATRTRRGVVYVHITHSSRRRRRGEAEPFLMFSRFPRAGNVYRL